MRTTDNLKPNTRSKAAKSFNCLIQLIDHFDNVQRVCEHWIQHHSIVETRQLLHAKQPTVLVFQRFKIRRDDKIWIYISWKSWVVNYIAHSDRVSVEGIFNFHSFYRWFQFKFHLHEHESTLTIIKIRFTRNFWWEEKNFSFSRKCSRLTPFPVQWRSHLKTSQVNNSFSH